MSDIIAISSMTVIWLRSVFLIGGTAATDTSTADIRDDGDSDEDADNYFRTGLW